MGRGVAGEERKDKLRQKLERLYHIKMPAGGVAGQ